MRCDDARLALSARLDGEDGGQPAGLIDVHLDGCAMCRAWLDGAERVTRTVRVRSVAVPDLTARILAAVHADGSLTGGAQTPTGAQTRAGAKSRAGAMIRPGHWLAGQRWTGHQLGLALRWTLGVLAVGQVMLAVPDLFGVVGHEAHAGREVAAFDIALAVGLLLVAWYPEFARVFAPVVVTLVVCFGSVSALDIMQGVVSPSRVAVHTVAVIQAVLVWWLARAGQRPSGVRAGQPNARHPAAL
jgi:predicted anti-sigma-YlaC factor YlaD